MRAEQQINIRIAFPDFLRNMRLLNRTAAYTQHKLLVLKTLMLHGADYAGKRGPAPFARTAQVFSKTKLAFRTSSVKP